MVILPFIPSCIQKSSEDELLDILSLLLSYLRLSVEIQVKAVEENLFLALGNLLRDLPASMLSVRMRGVLDPRKS